MAKGKRRSWSTKTYLFIVSAFWLALCAPLASSVPASTARRDPVEVDAWWVGELKPAMILRSDKPRVPQDVTFAMHYTHNRLNVLEMNCHLFPGIIAAAVYVPLANKTVHSPGKQEHGQHVSTVMKQILTLYEKLQKEDCILDLGIFTEDLKDLPEASYWAKMPVNAMRNMALSLADSEIVGIVDADFLVGPRSFVASLRTEGAYQQLKKLLVEDKGVVVMPAFEFNDKQEGETEGRNRTWRMATALDKHPIVGEYQAKSIIPFHHRYHLFTDYDRWCGTDDYYEVYYPEVKVNQDIYSGKAHPYEPYVLAWRDLLPTPMWDERFRGYHLNKIQGLAYLHHLGFKFFIHPEAYVIHWPHPVAPHEERMKEIYSDKSKKLEEIWDTELIDEVQQQRPFVPVAREHKALQALLH